MSRTWFGFADSPYLNCCRLYGHHHPDGRCWDDQATHVALIERLESEFDGWALCLSARSLLTIAPMAPADALVLSWVKPIAPPMGDGYQYSWEPVIVKPVRKPATYIKTHLVLSPPQFTFRPKPDGHVIGEKPEGFSHWVFEAAGLRAGDGLCDLFPGSGAVQRAWESYTAGRLDFAASCASAPNQGDQT